MILPDFYYLSNNTAGTPLSSQTHLINMLQVRKRHELKGSEFQRVVQGTGQ